MFPLAHVLCGVEISRLSTYFIIGIAVAFFAYVLLFGELDMVEKKRVVVIIALFLGAAMFWSGFEQAGSSLNLFADRYTQLDLGWIMLYSTWFQSVNSIFIILFAPAFAYLWVWLAKRNLNPSTVWNGCSSACSAGGAFRKWYARRLKSWTASRN